MQTIFQRQVNQPFAKFFVYLLILSPFKRPQSAYIRASSLMYWLWDWDTHTNSILHSHTEAIISHPFKVSD